jgi:hypothetical protein
MSGFVGVIVSDSWLHSQFTQVELRTLKAKVRISLFSNMCILNNNLEFVHSFV